MAESSLNRWIDACLKWPLRKIYEKPARILKGYIKPGMIVLDVGCGEGLYSIGMAKLVGVGGRVISVDPRNSAIEALKRKLAKSSVAALIEPRTCTDRELLPGNFAGNVDFALAVYVVHHARDAALLMANVYSVLKPGGTFLVVEPRHHASAEYCDATEETARQAGFSIIGHPEFVRDWAVHLEKCFGSDTH